MGKTVNRFANMVYMYRISTKSVERLFHEPIFLLLIVSKSQLRICSKIHDSTTNVYVHLLQI